MDAGSQRLDSSLGMDEGPQLVDADRIDSQSGDAGILPDTALVDARADLPDGGLDASVRRPDAGRPELNDAMMRDPLDQGQVMEVDVGVSPVIDAGPAPSFEDRLRDSMERWMLPRMQTDITEAEVTRQTAQYGGEVSFETALDAAIQSFLSDGRDEESPRSLALDVRQGPCLQDDLTERVRCFLNDERTSLTLVGQRGFPAENGESVEENWVFLLMAESLSDHLQWAIIDRTGQRETYNYGFN